MNSNIKMVAPCLFGIESIAADEFRRMGFEDVVTENGRVLLSGDSNMLARANINSRFAERILINMGQFRATSFTELFDNVKAIAWEEYIGREDAFPVNGWSIDSALHSIPDCQSIIKKAIVDRLSSKYGIKWFNETGPEYRVRFSIRKDEVTMMIDTSGEGLHKRGYRRNSNDAPLKETLAAAMCDLARIYPDTKIYDPFCGSGTILI
ncbi:MAG: THUMP domain-containing protein, partial [Acutalibacteraceae bacterium]|nr:THUMP domain-containing protein [Acutalibacteraceae bacterium]